LGSVLSKLQGQQEGFLASELRYFSKIYALLYYVRNFLLFIVKFEVTEVTVINDCVMKLLLVYQNNLM
jgi:hypothetical protein